MGSSYNFGVPGAGDSDQIQSLGIGTSAPASVGTVASAPPTSASVNAAFGSVTIGTPKQNAVGYDVLVNVSVVVTAATGATFVAGVDSTNTPSTSTIVASFSAAANTTFVFTFKVPNGYYLLLNDTGTITVGSTTTWTQAA